MSLVESERLILRPPRHADIQAMAVWLGDFEVASNLARVPYPYNEADAEDFVLKRGRHGDGHYAFCITRKQDGLFMGCIGLHLEDEGYEFGYWLGKPFWGMGYATEGARAAWPGLRSRVWTRPLSGPGGFTTIRPRAMSWPSWARGIMAAGCACPWPAAWTCSAMRCC